MIKLKDCNYRYGFTTQNGSIRHNYYGHKKGCKIMIESYSFRKEIGVQITGGTFLTKEQKERFGEDKDTYYCYIKFCPDSKSAKQFVYHTIAKL